MKRLLVVVLGLAFLAACSSGPAKPSASQTPSATRTTPAPSGSSKPTLGKSPPPIQWSCDVGKYEFLFDYDEFVYLIRGRVVVTDGDKTYVLEAGDTAHFPQGVTVIWEITERMTKYFVARAPF